MSPVPSRRRLRGARHRHGRAFYQAAFVVALLACYSIIRSLAPDPGQPKLQLHARSLQVQDEECRQVRQSHDQCAFIKANCPDEEAGLISYLQLFYCDLSAAKPVAFAILVLWLGFLFSTIGIAASDFLCINLNTIAAVLGMSESLTGVTFLAFGNGSPDVFSTFAAMSTHSGSLAVGELIGAAAFISSVVAGSMAVTKPFQVARKSFVRDISFFAAAAAFSLVFLADGKLVLWECIAMVAFYLFYVTFVVTWHWLVTKKRRIRLAENSARLQQHIPDQQELEVPEIDDDDEGRPANERSSLLRSVSSSSFPTLLEPVSAAWQLNEIEDDETRDRYLAELQSNMRVRHSRNRRNSVITPIRPSLMGALEFRSVLSSLEKRSTGVVLSMGRVSEHAPYSFDDLPPINHHHPGRQSTGNHLLGHPEPTSPSHIGRSRAVSADDTQLLEAIHNLNRPSSLAPASSGSLTPRQDQLTPRPSAALLQTLNEPTRSSSPKLLLSPAEISEPSSSSPLPAPRSPLHLAPPDLSAPQPEPSDQHDTRGRSPSLSGAEEQTTQIQVPILHVPQPNHIHRKSPLSHEFSRYRDSPPSTPRRSRSPSIIHLPPASLSPDSHIDIIILPDDESDEPKVYRWWPYQYLPPPHIIFSTFFPTLCGWRDKTILDKVMGLLTVPSVLLLTITLPVVDNSGDEEETGVDDAPSVQPPSRQSTGLHFGSDITSQPQTNGIVTPVHPHMSRQNSWKNPIAGAEELDGGTSGVKDWNRWLVFVQAFTAPLFMVSIIYANMGDGHSSTLFLRMVLGSLAFSLVMIAILLLTTTHDREPEHRSLFCFLGFAVAIAWISTIANEVVGVLKTFGVILDISDAILGLTVFAIGNSLGDLVADITVAKLGYPVMALSACFGGPMLNILLGIGVSGIYMMIRGASKSHAKHPDKPLKYKPYEIEVSTTLMISGVMLLVTLLGLLIMVPLNGWRFDRKIGIGLISLWTLTTIGNVVVEVLGYDGHWHSKLN